jgi:hypothetical protein
MPQEETVMDAVNAALGDAGTAPAPETETPESETPEPENLETPEPENLETEGDEPEGDGAEETDAEAEARGAQRDPVTGKFVKKGEEPKAPEGEKPKVEAKKEKDPINDPIPKDLKKETSERIRTLIDTAKTVTAERDQVKQDFDYLIKGVEATGTSPEQYGETLSWLALFNSRDPAQQEKALELVESVAERLATLLGKERTVGDPLSAHDDLKQAVAQGKITAQYAKEIARTRNGQSFRTELTTSVNQQEQQRQQAETELNTARTGLTALEVNLRASDPQYESKKAVLVQALKPVFAAIPPAQWVGKFQEAYKNLNLAPQAQAPKAKVPVNQPMRAGKQPAGGQTKAASSMLEAVSGAIAGMRK